MLAWIDIARIASIFCVIVIHTVANIVVSSDLPQSTRLVANFYDSFSRWCVPVFVMISGALLLNKHEPAETFFRKRAAHILMPMFFWTIFYGLWKIFKGFIKTKEIIFDTSETFYDFLTCGIYPHLWFIYMIAGLYLFTPMFRNVIQSISRKHLLLIIILGFAMSASQTLFDYFVTESTTRLFWITPLYYIPYFLLGHLISTTKYNPEAALLITVFVISSAVTMGLTFLLKQPYPVEDSPYPYDYLSISVIPASISMMFLLIKINKLRESSPTLRFIAKQTFGIYLIHIFFMEIFNFVGYNPVFAKNPILLLLHIPVYAVLVFCASLIACAVISRIKFVQRII